MSKSKAPETKLVTQGEFNEDGITGTISNSILENAQFRAGGEFGEVFSPYSQFDGNTLTIEVKSEAQARVLLEAILKM